MEGKEENLETNTTVKTILRDYVREHITEEETKNGKVLTIRTGPAPVLQDEEPKNSLRLAGIISACALFFESRKGLFDPKKSHVIFDKTAGTILFVIDENYEGINTHVEGKIIDNPDLAPFKINKGAAGVFAVKELMELLKFNRTHFPDKDENMKIVGQLQHFKATVQKTIEDSDDNRGNIKQEKIQKLETELALSFKLQMPIHKGGLKHSFNVDVLCNITDKGVNVWLESRELKELQVESINQIMDNELVCFKNAGVVCIEK